MMYSHFQIISRFSKSDFRRDSLHHCNKVMSLVVFMCLVVPSFNFLLSCFSLVVRLCLTVLCWLPDWVRVMVLIHMYVGSVKDEEVTERFLPTSISNFSATEQADIKSLFDPRLFWETPEWHTSEGRLTHASKEILDSRAVGASARKRNKIDATLKSDGTDC